MDCSKYQLQFTAFLDGDLAPTEREQLRAHLQECLTCYRSWSSLQKTREVLSQLPELDPPEHLSALVMARLKNRRFHQWSWMFGTIPRWLPLGLGVTALLVITVTLFQTMHLPLPWRSEPLDSQSGMITKNTASEQPAARLTATQRSFGSTKPVMVLKVEDFARVDQELESMLRSFSRSTLPERKPVRSVRTSSARLIDVQVSGRQFQHLIRELHKIGHLDHSLLESDETVTRNPHEAISIRIVVVSSGADTDTWRKGRHSQQTAESDQHKTGSRTVTTK